VSDSLAIVRGGLVVSVQAPPASPLGDPAVMAAIAEAAVAGGAAGIRVEGPDDVAAMRPLVEVPLIGLRKRDLPGTPVRITPTVEDALELEAAGADVIAVDATLRARPEGVEMPAFLTELGERLRVPVLADVDSVEAGLAARAAGAAAVATTLSGYTGDGAPRTAPDLALVSRLADLLDCPLIAEGRYGSPSAVRAAFKAGAYAVVVGTAISDPYTLTRRFAAAAAEASAGVVDHGSDAAADYGRYDGVPRPKGHATRR
jgi:N-acylglucosamine-6-phosphate 2-epimerase